MSLNDQRWITLRGDPITGRAPTQLVIMNDVPMTPEQYAGVQKAVRSFFEAIAVTPHPKGYHLHRRELSDGTRIRMESNLGVRKVMVWPTGKGGSGRGAFALHPAFWYSPVSDGQMIPTQTSTPKPNSGTWKNAPLSAASPSANSADRFWKEHPGNVTWFDPRPESKVRGLVLSWWSTGESRYGTFPKGQPFATPMITRSDRYKLMQRPINKLWCNGHLIGEFDRAVYGACIFDDAGTLKVCVVLADFSVSDLSSAGIYSATYNSLPTSAVPSGTKRMIGYGDSLSFDAAATIDAFLSLELKVLHAPLPGAFMQGVFRRLSFTQTRRYFFSGNETESWERTPITFDGYDDAHLGYAWWHPHEGMKFNASGTEGVFPIRAQVFYGVEGVAPTTLGMTAVVYGARMNTTTGELLSTPLRHRVQPYTAPWIDETYDWSWSPTGTPTTTLGVDLFNGHAYQFLHSNAKNWILDYEGDTLVWAFCASWIDYAPTGTRTFQSGCDVVTSKHGTILTDYYPPDWSPGTLQITGLSFGGDLRADEFAFLVGRYAQTTAPSRPNRLLTFRAGVLAADAAINPAAMTTDEQRTVELGCDISFDGRIVVSHLGYSRKVFVDGEDVTASVENAVEIKYPVLCGPFAWDLGRHERLPEVYVKDPV